MTVNAVGEIDDAGRCLARFLGHLQETYGVTDLDIVAHSMGGLFARASIRELRDGGAPLTVRTLTTIGTPWEGGFTADYAAGNLSLADCNDDPTCEESMKQFARFVAAVSEGAGEQVTAAYLVGAGGWNERQAGALSGLPVTIVAGDYCAVPGDERVWPNDGLVALRSARAEGVSQQVLPQRTAFTFPDVHSIYFANLMGLPWERALTWDPDVLRVVRQAIENRDELSGEARPLSNDARSGNGV
jgi:pimeloyl-ACP methyl ester carboxylesterase